MRSLQPHSGFEQLNSTPDSFLAKAITVFVLSLAYFHASYISSVPVSMYRGEVRASIPMRSSQ